MYEEQSVDVRYEPQVDLASGVIVGVEAIAHAAGAWALRRASKQVNRWHREGAGKVRLTVRMSAREILGEEDFERVRESIRSSGLEPRCIAIEIPEVEATREIDRIVPSLRRLKAFGVQVILGGFGIGGSSLETLQRICCDGVNIDPSLLRFMDPGERVPTVRAVVELARSLRLGVGAKGVESRRTAELLEGYGCEIGQGPFFGGPLPAAQLAAGLWVAAVRAGRWVVPAPWLSPSGPMES